MNTNTAVEASVVVVNDMEIIAALPSTTAQVTRSKSGKVTAKTYSFAGTESASAMRKRLKDSGYKGRALARMINESLSSEIGARKVSFFATAQELMNRGQVPDCVKIGKGMSTFVLREVTDTDADIKAKAEAAAKAKVAKVTEAAAALGLSEEAVASLIAALA